MRAAEEHPPVVDALGLMELACRDRIGHVLNIVDMTARRRGESSGRKAAALH
jgi:hypothetical protein